MDPPCPLGLLLPVHGQGLLAVQHGGPLRLQVLFRVAWAAVGLDVHPEEGPLAHQRQAVVVPVRDTPPQPYPDGQTEGAGDRVGTTWLESLCLDGSRQFRYVSSRTTLGRTPSSRTVRTLSRLPTSSPKDLSGRGDGPSVRRQGLWNTPCSWAPGLADRSLPVVRGEFLSVRPSRRRAPSWTSEVTRPRSTHRPGGWRAGRDGLRRADEWGSF